MIFSRLRRPKILHCIREYLSDNFHFSGNLGQSFPKNRIVAIAQYLPPPAELKQASNMMGWEIRPLLEENPTHTYGRHYRYYV